jgi:hypothetical protein
LGNVSGDAYPSDYRTVSQTVYGTKPLNPVNHDDVTRDWYDTSGWYPDNSTVFTDQSITQYKNQSQDHSTYTTNDRGDRYNEGSYTATRTIDQVVYGTRPLNPVNHDDVTRDWYDTSGWSPDPSGTYEDETLTQYKSQAQDHSTYTTNDRGDRYNERTYTLTRTIDQVVYGTKPLNPVNHDDVTRDWYDTSAWSPDASTAYTDETVTQYKDQAQDHSTYTTNDRGDRYNERTYTDTRTISQTVPGTTPRPPACIRYGVDFVDTQECYWELDISYTDCSGNSGQNHYELYPSQCNKPDQYIQCAQVDTVVINSGKGTNIQNLGGC